MNPQPTILNAEKAIINIIARVYRGESPERKKYGLHTLPSWAITLMIAVAQDLFSGVWLTADAAQVYTIAFAAKHPEMYKNEAKYRAGTFKVATEIMKPVAATAIETTMCQPRSLLRSLEKATIKEMTAPRRYGGLVHRSVTVLEPKLKPLTMAG